MNREVHVLDLWGRAGEIPARYPAVHSPGGMLGDAEDADAPGGVLDYGQDVGLGGKRRDKPAWRRGCESPTSKE
jgi:hypothetical protein